jgi:tetratricopeptide (TPR) repeat protein
MLDVGMWRQASELIAAGEAIADDDRRALLAYYHWLNNDYQAAEAEAGAALRLNPGNAEALKTSIRLLIEAWRLDDALVACRQAEEAYPGDLEFYLLEGRALILERRYDEADALAGRLARSFPREGGVYRLAADVRFWNLEPEKAEPLLVRSLELEPFNADARFSYGYAIWRRVDATQLNRMAAQWELALELNPLHFGTHWHWGNGHTNLTFADYAEADEQAIRAALAPADSLFTAGRTGEAVALARSVERDYPASALPLMHRASLWYGDFDNPLRSERLDSAAALFGEILRRKPHYGPAHNGLAAVIKSKRIPYLSTYDSIAGALRSLAISDREGFAKVFPDLGYYPGAMARAMVWSQCYTAIAYFPFLVRQGETFVVPPLHKDLAIAMNSAYFRQATTFDNRQWMDIRGVGSGAAAIEYVERGAYGERNVILHEYVHLFHESVLTDYQNRRIRALYYSAMANDRTLDYYSRNNEHEYLAQTYPAYFEVMKVHPLDFKSMNTTSALREKDPEMYLFLDSLVANERSYLGGDRRAMASNWAQAYVNLSRKRQADPALAARLLDTALIYDARYQPAHLAYARLRLARGEAGEALRSIQASEAIDPLYAPTYQAYAEWAKQAEADPGASLAKQAGWMEKALAVETDYQTRAEMAMSLRRLYADHAKVKEAVAAMDDYVRQAPEVSTYLRDRKDDARMYAAAQRALLGDRRALETMDSLVAQKPQNYAYAADYADALASGGGYAQARAIVERAQRILASNRNRRADFDLRLAEYHLAGGLKDSARVYYEACKENAGRLAPADRQRLLRLSLRVDAAGATAVDIPGEAAYPEHSPALVASMYHTSALEAEMGGDGEAAASLYEKSLSLNPYALPVYDALLHIYAAAQNDEEAAKARARKAAVIAGGL